ncbi:LOW QUALITY PROTEIN: hypothetical protein V1477_020177 [Vespula maculifrons]|uniref:Uncharacterized protein n=1 Tax=Vespula maculifrons TaxID=7453 RepID=A0ABD2AM03_VESMC
MKKYDYNFSLINKLEIVLVSFQHYIVHDALLSHNLFYFLPACIPYYYNWKAYFLVNVSIIAIIKYIIFRLDKNIP